MPYRLAHTLKRNHSSETIHNCIFVDVETDSKKLRDGSITHVLREGVACYQRRSTKGKWEKPEWIHFRQKEAFYAFIDEHLRPKIKLYVFCHNSNFDYPVLSIFDYLAEHGAKLKQAVLSGPPTIMRYRYNQATVILLDTLNIWRVPLKKLGEIVNVPKLEMPSVDAGPDKWLEYNKRDVEIIRVAVTRWADFILENDYGGFASTLAAQSMRLYRHRFMTVDIRLHDNSEALKLERECYHGGRNEVFMLGAINQPVHVLDVNSMYPSVMRDNLYPVKLVSYLVNPSINAVNQFSKQYLLCGDCELSTSEAAYPYRMDGRLTFPTGQFRAMLTTPEILYAMEHKHLSKCYRLSIYEASDIFRGFVDFLYHKRLEAEQDDTPTDSYLYKILLNSHYGKWGQAGYKTEYVGRQPFKAWKQYEVIDGVTGKTVKYRQLGYDLETIEQHGDSTDSFVAIAAHVTAYARLKLWRLINEANIRNVIYCDTDSIICNHRGYMRLDRYRDNKLLGALKLEGSYTNGYIWGCKDYTLGNKSRHKGVKSKAIWITPNTIEQDQWNTLRGMLHDGNLNTPITRRVTKHLRRDYRKGNVYANGRVNPYVLAEC